MGLNHQLFGQQPNALTNCFSSFTIRYLAIYCTLLILEDLILEEDLINILPSVYRANSMAKELKRNVNFEIVLMPPEARGLNNGITEVI